MKKNKRLLILVGILLVFGSLSLAYFVGRMLTDGSGATTTVTTAELKNSKVTVEGTLNFDYDGMLPGHKDVSGIIVTATGNNELIPYNLVWKGSNNLNTDLKFTVYKVSEKISVESECEKVKKNVSGGQMLYEECEISNLSSLGEAISEGTIKGNSIGTTVTLASNEFIISTSTGATAYYYVLLEYPNLNENQNLDMGQGFEGEVKVEPSNIEPDINILAVNVINEETGTYEERTSISIDESYSLNEEKSQCNNGAKPIWNEELKGLTISNLTASGTECYLYFNKPATKVIMAGRTIQNSLTSFTGPDATEHKTTNNKSDLYKSEDDLGDTYYFRGVVDDNWIKFGKTTGGEDLYWRIIRINGNGSIRVIYNGTSTEATGLNTQLSSTSTFNSDSGDNMYVGFMYGSSSNNYATTHANDNKSTILKELERWFVEDTNIDTNYLNKLDTESGFCNDRKLQGVSGYTGNGVGKSETGYAPYSRLSNGGSWKNDQQPTFKCSQNNDNFTVIGSSNGNQKLTYPVGLITSDEAVFAGGFGGANGSIANNDKYYLYTGQNYWTMSPSNFNGYGAFISNITNLGAVYNPTVTYSYGVRPVLNISSNITLIGSGLSKNPYIVVTN